MLETKMPFVIVQCAVNIDLEIFKLKNGIMQPYVLLGCIHKLRCQNFDDFDTTPPLLNVDKFTT